MKTVIKYRLVHVIWQDSFGCSSSWGGIPEKAPNAHYCESVGWVAKQNDSSLVLIPHISPENKEIEAAEQGCGEMTIPKNSIMKITELRKK